ncbi:hypothetical protein FOA52_013466 [Chlamydomonas sp. UWO 241]|nr:hypothetical protein FOA52_013466 [Chlamydomonas sp. UWO 241]
MDYDSDHRDAPTPTSGSGSAGGSYDGGPLKTGLAAGRAFEVLRLDTSGRVRQGFTRRRDLLREYKLKPRDLRRIDPSVDVSRTPASIITKDNVILMCLGGVRAIVTAQKTLLFEPELNVSRKFMEVVLQHMQVRLAGRAPAPAAPTDAGALSGLSGVSHSEYMHRFYQKGDLSATTTPFELEVIEAALMVAIGRLEGEMGSVRGRWGALMSKLPQEINPVTLEELRRVKGALVELEQKADTLRNLLEELMDDEDELREMNLTNRPRREERKRQRERERLERELDRAREIKEEIEKRLETRPCEIKEEIKERLERSTPAREIKEEIEERLEEDGSNASSSSSPPSSGGPSGANPNGNGSGGGKAGPSGGGGGGPAVGGSGVYGAYGQLYTQSGPSGAPPTAFLFPGAPPPGLAQGLAGLGPGGTLIPSAPLVVPPAGLGPMGVGAGSGLSREQRQTRIQELRSKFDRARLAELRAKFNWSDRDSRDRDSRDGDQRSEREQEKNNRERRRERETARRLAGSSLASIGGAGESTEGTEGMGMAGEEREREEREDREREEWISRLEGSEEDIQEAQEALEEMVEQEEEDQEVEEVEDLFEYYLQRSSALQDEAERLLAGARDLEESIGISLSARRYEVNRLELTLSIGSFAAAVGAMTAGIFGMNMRSMLEASVVGFWGVSAAIVLGCIGIVLAVLAYTRMKRIL